MEAYYTTIQIVLGILSPIIFVLLLVIIANGAKNIAAAMLIKAEEIKKMPPFDEVETNVNPATRVMVVRFIKNGNVIWQGSSSQRELDESDILTFTAKDEK